MENPVLINTEPLPPRGNTMLGYFRLWFLSTNQYITLPYVFLRQLIYIFWFINVEPMATTQERMPDPSLSNTHISPIRHIPARCTYKTRRHLSTMLGTTLNSNITNTKHKFQKSRPWLDYERTPIYSIGAKTRRRSVPCLTSRLQMTMKAGVLIWGLQINSSE